MLAHWTTEKPLYSTSKATFDAHKNILLTFFSPSIEGNQEWKGKISCKKAHNCIHVININNLFSSSVDFHGATKLERENYGSREFKPTGSSRQESSSSWNDNFVYIQFADCWRRSDYTEKLVAITSDDDQSIKEVHPHLLKCYCLFAM